MVAPRALVFRPLVKGNEALGTRLGSFSNDDGVTPSITRGKKLIDILSLNFALFRSAQYAYWSQNLPTEVFLTLPKVCF